jgi:hypothetical protein
MAEMFEERYQEIAKVLSNGAGAVHLNAPDPNCRRIACLDFDLRVRLT